MKNPIAIIHRSILLMSLCSGLFLAGCSSQATLPTATLVIPTNTLIPPTPTMTDTALPSATSTLQPTSTFTPLPSATFTLLPSATFTLVPTATTVPTSTRKPPTATKVPTSPLPLSAQVLKVWTYQNKNTFIANEGFLLAVYMKNTGKSTWDLGFQLRYTGQTDGGDITVQPVVNIPKEVKPGDKVEFDMWAFGSEKLGPNTMFFSLFDGNNKVVPGSQAEYSYTALHN